MVWLFCLFFFSPLKSTLSNIICTFIVLEVTSHYVLYVRGWCPVSHSSQHKLPQGDQDPITKCRGCPGIVFYFIFWWWLAGYTLTLLLYGCLTNKNINEWIWVEIILSSREWKNHHNPLLYSHDQIFHRAMWMLIITQVSSFGKCAVALRQDYGFT